MHITDSSIVRRTLVGALVVTAFAVPAVGGLSGAAEAGEPVRDDRLTSEVFAAKLVTLGVWKAPAGTDATPTAIAPGASDFATWTSSTGT